MKKNKQLAGSLYALWLVFLDAHLFTKLDMYTFHLHGVGLSTVHPDLNNYGQN